MVDKASLDLRQSEAYGRYMQSMGWEVLSVSMENTKKTAQVFVKKIGPVALAKLQRPAGRPDMNQVNKLVKEKRIFMLKLEPGLNWQEEEIKKLCAETKFKRDNSPLLATKTTVVDLTMPEQDLMAGFKKDARYCLRKLEDKNISVDTPTVGEFYEIWRQSAKRKGLWIPKKSEVEKLVAAFGEKVILVRVGGQSVACILVCDKTAFYYYAGSTASGVKMNYPYLAVWKAMLVAKKMGCVRWDFEGIYDERWPIKAWRGFSHFKSGFGGKEVEFLGAYSWWRLPI